jgi:two-component system chemotaxis sensor kinase CheA
MNPDGLREVFEREQGARLEAARRHLERGDLEALGLEVHRVRVAARAADEELSEAWTPVLRALERGERVRADFQTERATPSLTPERLRRAARAAGVRLEATPDTPMVVPEVARLEPARSSPPVAPAPRAASVTAPERPSSPPEETLRVAVSKLDALLALAGELRVAGNRARERGAQLRSVIGALGDERRQRRRARGDAATTLERVQRSERDRLKTLSALERAWARDAAHLGLLARGVEDEVLGARLLPAAMLLPPLERLVRDLGAQLGKNVALISSGADVEMDRRILEAVRDPLMHMIRNSLDHGIESPEARAAQGKSAQARIALTFQRDGSALQITLSDDGAGIDVERVRAKAVAQGLLDGSETDERVVDTIFEPGFSTAAAVTETSGRGVGMDVVRENLRALSGSVAVHSRPGLGASFVVRVPVQLATTRVLLVRVGAYTLALPTLEVRRTGRVQSDALTDLGGASTVRLEAQALRAGELGAVLGVAHASVEGWQPFVVVGAERAPLLLFVDALIGEEEVVVKRLGFGLENQTHLAGAAVLGDARLVPILSSSALIERFERRGAASARPRSSAPKIAVRKKRVLVVDDSVTTRTLERSILEASGFETRTAINGLEALEVLRSDEIDLVLSDVEMPLLDGFGLTRAIRDNQAIAHIPVILVTSLHEPEHRQRGADAGADAYVVKGEFDQNVLLSTIGRLL